MVSMKEQRWIIDTQNKIIDGLYEKIERLEKQLAQEKERKLFLKATTPLENKIIVEIKFV